MPVANVGALLRDADQPNRSQSWPAEARGAAPADTASTSAALKAKPRDRAGERRRLELSVPVLSEGRERGDLPLDAGRREPSVAGLEAPDRAAAVVAVEIAALRARDGGTAIHVAACDRAGAAGVRVRSHRGDQVALAHERIRRVVGRLALEAVPAVVRKPADLGRVAVVDLFPVALADVADPEVARLVVEREAPRVPKPDADALSSRSGAHRVDAKQLAEPALQVLGPVLGVAAATAVDHAHVE